MATLSLTSLKAARAALYDYKFETQSYLGNWKPGEPKATDLCCEDHKFHFDQQESWNQALATRLEHIVIAIAEVEASILEAEPESESEETSHD